ncbi:MAG: HD-GYP domain-containing protein [Pseudomonadota bacterium]
MKRQVDVQDLRIGMYISDLDRPWLETPFLFQGFEIRNDEDLETLRRYCRHVYVLDRDSLGKPGARVPNRPAPAPQAVDADRDTPAATDSDLLRLTNHPSARPIYPDRTTVEEEIGRVTDTTRAAHIYCQQMFEDARLGRGLNVPQAKQLVGEMVDSVLRNPDALTCFTLLKKKDSYTAEHSLRVAVLALVFGRHLGFERDMLHVLGLGALLHDIGKALVPLDILNKPKALDAREIEIMKQHVPWGLELLDGTSGIPRSALEVVGNHHERYDGHGYMAKLTGADIGQFGMIGAIADTYDALTSDRVYRSGSSPHAALKRMYELRAAAFHPQLAEQFIQCLGIYPVGSIVQLNTREVGVVAGLNRDRRLKPHLVLARRADNTPYPAMPAVNLATRTTREGKPCEIERVLEPADCGINPAYFLPVPAVS